MPQVALRRDDQIRDAGGIQDSRLGTREVVPVDELAELFGAT